MRNPSGYGSVYKLSGKRRKPWAVRITTGWELVDGKEKQIRKIIGYYSTRSEGLQALAEYNIDPYDPAAKKLTFADVYKIWSEKKYPTLTEHTVTSYKSSYLRMDSIKDRPLCELKTKDLQEIIDTTEGMSVSTMANIKCVFNGVYEYALANDIVSKDYARLVKLPKSAATKERQPFSKTDIEMLWNLQGDVMADILLMLIYTGMRVNELLSLKKENIDIQNRKVSIIESKTDAGIREVPLCARILPIFEFYYNKGRIYLLESENGYKLNYRNLMYRNMKKINSLMTQKHKTHDCRVTFVSRWKELHLDELYLKKIVGHRPSSVTEKVYTKVKFETLAAEIEKLYFY